ncbi:hypothetical protein ACH4A8_38260 [Streptomyces vietnamensis]|uniref:hypothetical protein n=1 Tax=Streptomyces vietnamensis TaxID=362257 RepID=UPI0037B33A83
MIIVVPVVGRATPDADRFDRFLFAVPAPAAVAWGPAAAAGIGLLTMAVEFALAAGRAEFHAQDVPAPLLPLPLMTLVSACSGALRKRRERLLRQVGAIADAAQRTLQRPLPSRLGSVDLHLLYGASAQGVTHLHLADRHGGSPSPTMPTTFVPVSMALSGILRLRRTPQEEDLFTPTR